MVMTIAGAVLLGGGLEASEKAVATAVMMIEGADSLIRDTGDSDRGGVVSIARVGIYNLGWLPLMCCQCIRMFTIAMF